MLREALYQDRRTRCGHRKLQSVSLSDVTRPDVLAAVREFDRLGRDAFLTSYRFGPAKYYFLSLGGKRYDSKAIMGYAHGVSAGRRLTTDDFTGGEASVGRRLRALGFDVENLRSPEQFTDQRGEAFDPGEGMWGLAPLWRWVFLRLSKERLSLGRLRPG